MRTLWPGSFLIFCLCLFLSACFVTSKAPPADIKTPELGFIYGYVEANDEPIERVDILEFGRVYVPPFNKPPRVLVYDNGIFMAGNVKPGKYIIGGFHSDKNHYNMIRSKRKAYQRVIHVAPGSINYIGSFQVRVIQRGKLDFGDFKVNPLQRPGERDVLKHLYAVTAGTAWQNKISHRLKYLRQF